MRTLIEVFAGLAIVANAVIYGTDVFGAIVLRPAIASVDDGQFVPLMGHVHRFADQRYPAISVSGLIAAAVAAALAAASTRWVSTAAGGIATLALVAFAVVYSRISKPINAKLTAAAVAEQVPANARQLQTRWDSVIDLRVGLQTLALAGLCVALGAAR